MQRLQISNQPFLAEDEDDNSQLSLFNEDNNDRVLFNSIDAEIIKLAGSEVQLFKYIPSEDVDEVYMESRQKTIELEPIKLYCQYDPRPIEESLSQFGVEVQNEQVFIFNKSYVERRIGRKVIPGDVIKPSFQNIKFEVYQVQEDSFENYGIYHLMVYAKLLRDTENIHNESILNTNNQIGGKL